MIAYLEKGAGLHAALAAAGLHLLCLDGGWSAYPEGSDAAAQAIIDAYDPLPYERALADARIDAAAGAARARYITVAPGQEATYQIKEAQARAYQANGTVGAMLAAEADATGKTPAEVAAVIVATADAWLGLAAQIEALRMAAKGQVKAATDWTAIAPIAAAAEAALGGRVSLGTAPLGTLPLGTAPSAGASAQTITCTGIASAEAFGTATLTPGAVSVQPAGIASAEAFGTATLTPGAVSVQPAGIASAEAFGAATLANGITVAAEAIASAEAFGLPVVTPAGVIVSPPSIDSAAAFGTARVYDPAALPPVLSAPRQRQGSAAMARPAARSASRRAAALSTTRR